jgi:hypothetical protein
MKPLVFSVSSAEQIEGHIQSLRQDGLTPTLAIVFSSIAHNLTEVGAAFAKFNIEVFGASTSGEIIKDEVYEGSKKKPPIKLVRVLRSGRTLSMTILRLW